ncbi:hypothetical protein I5R92_17155 [Pseudomonas carnis]|uniref:hypothetical protein n=1 Tax=Pseudomonas carnis TaxID=2487355 RepID=UPI0018D7CA7F|nr:hypothetical protein [Pseudomonas carnis]MBH3369018.1 hypothetical protein [Pseudomonas carnis]
MFLHYHVKLHFICALRVTMTRTLLTISLGLLTAPTAFGDSLYLNCTQTEGPAYNLASAYKKAPQDVRAQFLQDALEQGIVGNFIQPPTSWEIDLLKKTIVSPEESHKVINVLSDSPIKIEGASGAATFTLNRINATLAYSVRIDDGARDTWQKVHGGKLPETLTYKYKCASSNQPAL